MLKFDRLAIDVAQFGWLRKKRWLSFSLLFLISLRNATRRFYTRLKPTVLARQLHRKVKKRKSSRMPIALRRWGR